MLDKLYASSGLLSLFLAVIAYLIFSSDASDYDHLKDTYDALRDSQNFGFWGYIVPGLLIAMQGFYLKETIIDGGVRWLPIGSFILSGVFFALGAFPPIESGSLSFFGAIHEVGVMGNYFFFLVAGLTISDQLKADEKWRPVFWKQTVLLWCAMLMIILRGIESIDGLAQKLNLFFYFLWVAVFSIRGMVLQNKSE